MPKALHPEDQPLVTWACDDPSVGYAVHLTERDLLSHVIILGSTGAGKSTLLIQAMRQLIASPLSQPVGLLIYDPKVDGTVEMVRALAKAAGRERDVVVLGPNGDHHFDLFGGRVVGLAEVDYVVQRLLAGTQDMGPQNAFWNEARYSMLHAAITLLTIVHDQFSFETATEFLRAWFFSLRTNPKVVTQAVERARRFLQRADAPPAMLRQVQSALDQVELYQVLEGRTRSNLQSCLINALRPWTGVTAAQCFEATGRPAFDPGRVASEGKICIVSANALASQLAQALFRLVWQDYFAAIQQRRGVGHRLTGVIAEELPLLVRPGQD